MPLNPHMGLFVVHRNYNNPADDAFPHARGALATMVDDLL
jgi:hypothetical protein